MIYIKKYKKYIIPFIIINFFISVFLYRIFRIRILGPIENPYNELRIFFYVISILIALVISIQLIFGTKFFNKKKPSKIAKKLVKWKKEIKEYFDKVYHNIYDKFLFKIPKFVYIITYLMPKWFSLEKYFIHIINTSI